MYIDRKLFDIVIESQDMLSYYLKQNGLKLYVNYMESITESIEKYPEIKKLFLLKPHLRASSFNLNYFLNRIYLDGMNVFEVTYEMTSDQDYTKELQTDGSVQYLSHYVDWLTNLFMERINDNIFL